MYLLLDSRLPWIAVLLSFVFPGLGHIYCGFWLGGVLWFAALYTALLLFAAFADVSQLPVFYALFISHGLFYVLIVFDAFFQARKIGNRTFNHRTWLPVYIVLAVAIWLVESYYLHHRNTILGVDNYRLASGSMTPRLQQGDYVIVDTSIDAHRDLDIGDVAVFSIVGEEDAFVKRVAALGGDKIEIRLGQVFRNDVFEPQLEVLDQRRRRPNSQTMKAVQVPPGQVFMLGDWRDNSKDSRRIGTVPLIDIVGRVSAVWFSKDFYRIGQIATPTIIRQ